MTGMQSLVFDFDGLILDTEVPEYTTVAEVFADHGVPLPIERWVTIVGRADNPHWLDWLERELGAPLDDREAVRLARVARHHALIHAEVVRPGVVDLLDEADGAGVPTAVASSSPRDWVEGHLARLDLRQRFAAVLTSDDVERGKPWPDLYLAATAAVAADPAASVALEDSAHGCTAAKAAGLTCVVAPNDVTRGSDFTAADLVVGSLAEVDLVRLGALLPAASA